MKHPIALPVLLGTLVAAGCGLDSGPPPAVATPEEAVPTMQATFESATPEVKQQVETAVNAIQSQDDGAAYLSLETLSKEPELTPEQRQAMIDAWMAVNRRLATAASNGNETAEALLNRYRASK